MYAGSANGRVTKVDASTSAVDLIGAAKRDTVSVYYDDSAILYLLVGTGTPSSTNYSAKLGAGYLTYWEAPNSYRGPVKGVWSAASGSALVTEYA